MIVAVDPRSAVPPYEQLRAQVVDLVRTGALAAGARLPTVRQLAGDLGLAPGTVARAYKELERDGVVVAAGRRGTVVAPHGDALQREAQEAAAAYAALARRLGLPAAEALALVRAALG